MSIPAAPRPTRRPLRWPLVALLLVSLAFSGFVIGSIVGAGRVPAGSGLAGSAIALGYGALGVGVGLVLGGFLGWLAPHGLLQPLTAVAVVMGVAAAGLVAWRLAAARRERLAAAGLDAPLPASAGFRIESRITDADEMRRYRELSVDADTWQARWVAVGPGSATCTAPLIAAEAEALRRGSEAIRAARDHFKSLCGLPEGAATHVYTFQESVPRRSSWSIAADFRCLQQSPELSQLDVLLGQIPIAAVSHGRADCGG